MNLFLICVTSWALFSNYPSWNQVLPFLHFNNAGCKFRSALRQKSSFPLLGVWVKNITILLKLLVGGLRKWNYKALGFFFTETNKHVISKISYYFLLSSLSFLHLITQDITLVPHVGKNLPSRSYRHMGEELEYNYLAEIDGWRPTETNPQGTGIFL